MHDKFRDNNDNQGKGRGVVENRVRLLRVEETRSNLSKSEARIN